MSAKISITIIEATDLPKGIGTLFWKLKNSENETKEKSGTVKKPPSGQNYVWNQKF